MSDLYTTTVAAIRKGQALPAIAKATGEPLSKVARVFYRAELEVDPKLAITAKTDAALGKLIRTARDQQKLRWERIAVRTDRSVEAVRSLYVAAGGDLEACWTGKGTKRVRQPKVAAAATTPAATPAKAKTAKAKSGRKPAAQRKAKATA